MMQDDTVQELLTYIRSRYFGKYRGTVESNEDPDNLGRLEIRVPAVLGEQVRWAMPCVPYAGDSVGFKSLPDAGTGVWVEFEGGDPAYPIWTGFFWGDGEMPEPDDPNVRVWYTTKNNVKLDDTAEELQIESVQGGKVTLADKVLGELSDSTLTLDSQGARVEASGRKVDVSAASVSINDGNLEVF